MLIEIDDLPASVRTHELASLFVAGATSKAIRVAPCLGDNSSAETLAEARLILIGAVSRWADAGAGATVQQSAGPWSQTTETRSRGYNLWPSEITDLQALCAGGKSSGGAYSIRPAGGSASHMPWCALAWNANYCSCGSDLTGYAYPLFEGAGE